MLVLSRKQGQEIVMSTCGTTVTVLAVEGSRVRLGISAPSEVPIRRGELSVKAREDSYAAHEVEVSETGVRSTIRVLIADTDEFLLDAHRQQLAGYGCEVATATTGIECLAKLRDEPPDVLVLEPAIPWGGGDGVLALMHDHADTPLVPVIVLTSSRDPGMLYRLAPFQVDDFQSKPMSAKKLAERIQMIVSQRRWDDRQEPSVRQAARVV